MHSEAEPSFEHITSGGWVMTKKLYFKIDFGHENGRYTQERLNLKCESV
jgi:hypothetical protein